MIDLETVKPCDLWYVIGYIATDGCLSIDGRHIIITSKDRDHLYSIKQALNLNIIIGNKARAKEKEKKYSHLQIGDVSFYRYLISIGITPKKSLTIGSLKIENRFFNDFLRGVIDGDGNISTWLHKSNNHRQWCLRIYTASKNFANWLVKEIEDRYSVRGKVYTRKNKNGCNIMYILKFGKNIANQIFDQVYYLGCLALERKYLKAQSCIIFTPKSEKLNQFC